MIESSISSVPPACQLVSTAMANKLGNVSITKAREA